MKKLLLSTLIMANGMAVASPFVVQDIRVDGIQPDIGTSIISSLPIKIGQRATDDDIANVVRQLFLQKRFQDVSANREGNTLVIKVVEFPVINNVSINGNSAIPREPLEENLKANLISRGEVFDSEKLESFKEALTDHYHSIGRYNAQIDSEIIKAESGSVDIKLDIKEGDVSYVKTVTFEGNNDFDSDELLDQLDIQPDVKWWNIFSSGKFEQPVYNQDMENLRNFYMNRGYAKFSIENSDASFSDDKKEVFLTYKINEGQQYRVSEIRIIGDTAKMDNELNELLVDFEPGQQFRRDDLAKIEENIKTVLGDSGFASAKVDTYPIFDDENKTVRINYVVEAGKRIYVRRIRFEGNTVTADSTLRREMRQQEGAWLSTSLAELSKLRLDRTGFYESVEVSYPKVNQSDDQVDLVYKVKERNTGSINFGIGYGTESGLSYQAGIKQDNFLGMGSTISLNGSRNDYGTTLSLGYTEPYFTKDGVSLGGNIFYEDYDNSRNDNVSSYKRQTYGVSGTLGFPVDENNSYYLGLGYTHDKIKNAQREFSRDLYVRSLGIDIPPSSEAYKRIKADDFDFSFGWNYNSLDRGYLPTEGTIANIGGKITIPGSDNKYYKLSAGFKNYYPLNRDHSWIIQTSADVAYANGIGGKRLPFYQNYTAGGIGSLRGFGYGAIGPKAIYLGENGNGDPIFNRLSEDVIGGNAMATASLELITPTPFVDEKYQSNVRTSIFIDAASVWNTKWKKNPILGNQQYNFSNIEDFKDYKRIRASIGIAFQWNSPIGPLLFSYAKPIKKYKGDEIEQFQFSIGGSF
ncbi:outer membrane protein assembly factor BamA [Otariodibacter oris]|uniref:Outer membrane protein assembly factor BamA n=1 Tax=Otariodibacter oris TaxID=1032623 RepID=A0A420XI56_9PAST|nr:outer membrane protein assembly factor BamA [Otariodibacter oris]QGM80900.1 outer membrane protein assembly factor BamA [Otariodibacter oris]RKR76926.1 Beta-barrel assembly machine subunit BamA [Otariodibacter oris]